MQKTPELKRLILWYGLGGVFGVFLLLASVSSYVVWSSYKSKIEDNNQLVLQGIGQAIEEYLDQPLHELNLLATILPETHNREIQGLIDHFQKLDSRFQRIQIHDLQGHISWTSPSDSQSLGHDMSQQLFFKIPRQTQQVYWSPVFLSPIEEIATLALSLPFEGGVLTAFLSMENLAEFQLSKEFIKNAQLYVTDHTGTFLLHPDINTVKERATFPQFVDLKKSQHNPTILHSQVKIGKERMHCSGMMLSKYDWGVFLIQPNSIFLRPVLELVFSLAGVMAFAGILALLFGVFLFQKIYRPFQSLIHQMGNLGSGGSVARIDFATYKEYSEIIKQFNLMAEQISERQRALSMKNKELESMLYIATHDLRTPLVNIAGFSQELEGQFKELSQNISNSQSIEKLLHTEIPNSLHFVIQSTRRMDQLLQGLLRVARLNRSELIAQAVDLNDLFKTITDNLNFATRNRNASIQIEQLPSVKGDPSELQQVFSNLIENALKYSHPERLPELRVSAKTEDGFAWIAVQDNGLGVSELHQKKIFNIFFRVGDQPTISGEGLGLTIVQRIVERHQGEITLTSVPGEGSVFMVKLPIAS